MKKIIWIGFCFLFFICNANALNEGEVNQLSTGIDAKVYIDDNEYSKEVEIITINGNISYSYDFLNKISNENYDANSFSSDRFEEISFLEEVSHFGYQYNDRDDVKYYLATQKIIWESLGYDDIVFINNLKQVIDVSKEEEEILNDVTKYEEEPYIPLQLPDEIIIGLGDTLSAEDGSGTLSQYESNLDFVTINGNELFVDAKNAGPYEINLVKRWNDVETVFYTKGDSRRLVTFGCTFSKREFDIRLKIRTRAFVEIKLFDIDTNEIIKIDNAYFKIFDILNNEYINYDGNEIFETVDGILNIPFFLEESDYYIEQVKAPYGYELVDEKQYIYLDFKSPKDIEMTYYNKKMYGSIEIKKYGEYLENLKNNEIEYKDILLNGVEFSLYAQEDIYDYDGSILFEKDQIIDSKITKEGSVIFDNLPYGKYYIVETSGLQGFIFDDKKYEFSIIDNQRKNMTIRNNLEKYNLTIIKTDGNIFLEDAVIEIYNEEKQLLNRYFTDKNGKIIIENLPYGIYYVKECKAPDGYQLDDTFYKVVLKENKELKINNDKLDTEVVYSNLDSHSNEKEIDDSKIDKYVVLDENPNTGDDTVLNVIILLVLTISCLLYLILKKDVI